MNCHSGAMNSSDFFPYKTDNGYQSRSQKPKLCFFPNLNVENSLNVELFPIHTADFVNVISSSFYYFLPEISLCSRVVICCLRAWFLTFAQPHFHSRIYSGVTSYQNGPKYLVSCTMWKGALQLSLHWLNSYSKYEGSVGKYNIIWVNSYSKYEASVGKYTIDSSVGNTVKYVWNFSGGKFWMFEAQTNHVLA